MCNPLAEEEQAMRTDVYEKITNQIVLKLDKGISPGVPS
jgi:antirestriction protein ArdC